jgi:hypothetical protein
MKTIKVNGSKPSLKKVLQLAARGDVVLQTAEGKEFVLSPVDDFSLEVALVRQNQALMRFLARRSKEAKKYTVSQVRSRLGLR